MVINAITYLTICKKPRKEIKEASKKVIHLRGNKFSLSHPLIVTINKDISASESFCRKCGNKLVNNSKFCGSCGTEIITKVEGM